MQNDIDNMFLRKAQATIDLDPDNLFLVKFGNLFPFLIPFFACILTGVMLLVYLFRKIVPAWFLPQLEELPPTWILHRVKQVIDSRTSNEKQSRSVDLLQLMLDASTKHKIQVRNHIQFLLKSLFGEIDLKSDTFKSHDVSIIKKDTNC